ncbi:GNAT family N-acetyltransferase [Salipaludibacillus neizhouensis]|uniref:GNAT family N-acetyltransferase n=1 Tax=Salipaludibacillus neizhouensis TaxID=885475 RepID=A0A3A9K7H0_9BACI|nr:GNAT family N-acetyltransferase [Salipaludibacillus neizhouensis]RKL67428.1 GNAT family N-acetyltransferase [Salipaludibacillus neizhouensis]
MEDQSFIQKIEELSLNALPALQTHLFDGWVLRFADGYTKRANSINALYFSKQEVEQKIDISEQIYEKRNLRTVYKITPQVFPQNLDKSLDERDYVLEGITSVQLLPLEKIELHSAQNVEVYEYLHDSWLSAFCRLSKIKENDQSTMKQILRNIVPGICYAMVIDDNGNVVACGRGVLEGEYIGLYDIITDEKYRYKGYGEKLVLQILQWGKESAAKFAYLQVMISNVPALNLYSKIGFEEKYSYYYRIKK